MFVVAINFSCCQISIKIRKTHKHIYVFLFCSLYFCFYFIATLIYTYFFPLFLSLFFWGPCCTSPHHPLHCFSSSLLSKNTCLNNNKHYCCLFGLFLYKKKYFKGIFIYKKQTSFFLKIFVAVFIFLLKAGSIFFSYF